MLLAAWSLIAGLTESTSKLFTWGPDLIVGNCVTHRNRSNVLVVKNNADPQGIKLNWKGLNETSNADLFVIFFMLM